MPDTCAAGPTARTETFLLSRSGPGSKAHTREMTADVNARAGRVTGLGSSSHNPLPMTTVLFADRDGASFGPLGARIVPALLPLGGIPALEHALEALVRAGRRSALLVVGPRAGEIERRFGKGIRWGIALEIVRREDAETPGDVLRRLEPRLDGETIVVRGDVGVHAVIGEFLAKVDEARGPVVAGLLGGRPAGLWRLLPGALKKKDFPVEPGAAEWVKDPDFAALALSEGPILLADVASYYRADRMAAGTAPALSERSMVDGSAALLEGTTVAEEAVVLAGARLSAVSVLPRTAIPPGVTLENAIVSGNLVVDAATGATSLLTDRLPPAQKKPPRPRAGDSGSSPSPSRSRSGPWPPSGARSRTRATPRVPSRSRGTPRTAGARRSRRSGSRRPFPSCATCRSSSRCCRGASRFPA